MRLELYYSYIDTCDDRLTVRLWDALPAARRTQLAARPSVARAEGAALTALLTHAVGSWRGGEGVVFRYVDADALDTPYPRWETAPDGKPFAAGIPTPQGQAFVSFSHSAGHLLVAVCDRPLGADIQVWDAPAFAPDRFRRTAARIAHPAEEVPATPRETARRFAAKEATLKQSGEGLRRALSTVAVTAAAAGDLALYFCEEVPACIIAAAVSR